MTHQRVFRSRQPFFIIPLDILHKSGIGLVFLHQEHFFEMSLGLFQFQFPIYQPTIHIIPVFPRKRIVDLDIDAIEILLVTARRFFRNNLFPIEIFFDGKQDLIGIDRLYQIINCVHLVAIQCILRIGSGKDYQCPFGNGTGKLNSRNAGHLNIQKDKVYYVLLHKVGSRGGTVKTSH